MLLTARESIAACNSSALLERILAQPDYSTAYEFAEAYEELCRSHPYKADLYAAALSTAILSPVTKTMMSLEDDGHGVKERLQPMLVHAMYERIKEVMYEPYNPTIHPGNTYLIASMMCAAAIRAKLTYAPEIGYEIVIGLEYRQFIDGEREVKALGSYMHLLIAGSQMVEEGSEGYVTTLKEKFKHIPKIVTHPAMEAVVKEICEQFLPHPDHSKTCKEVWSLMFPEVTMED